MILGDGMRKEILLQPATAFKAVETRDGSVPRFDKLEGGEDDAAHVPAPRPEDGHINHPVHGESVGETFLLQFIKSTVFDLVRSELSSVFVFLV